MLEVEVIVEVLDRDGVPIEAACKEIRMSDTEYDRIAAVRGDGTARVAMAVTEKIGGPNYSSVSILCNVSIHCAQTEEGIRLAQKLSFEEAALAVDTYFPEAVAHLSKTLREVNFV